MYKNNLDHNNNLVAHFPEIGVIGFRKDFYRWTHCVSGIKKKQVNLRVYTVKV